MFGNRKPASSNPSAPWGAHHQTNIPMLGSHEDLDLAIVIQTTRGMIDLYEPLRQAVTNLVLQVRRTVSRPRIAVVCYKDHDSEGESEHYLTLTHKLSSNFVSIVDFLSQPDIAFGQGGGGAEALECALHSCNELAWRNKAHKAVIVIGDKPPHGGGLDSFHECPHHNDYRDEVEAFRRHGIRLYTVLLGDLLESRRVYEWMAAETRGAYIQLERPVDLAALFMGITHRECGRLGRYSRELKSHGRLNERQRRILTALSA